MTLLLHKDVFIPESVVNMTKILESKIKEYTLSNHLCRHINNSDDKHNYLMEDIKKTIVDMKLNPEIPFEVEMSDDNYHKKMIITKYCIRKNIDSNSSISIVIRPMHSEDGEKYKLRENMIVTAWINDTLDNHATLDKSKYISENYWKGLFK